MSIRTCRRGCKTHLPISCVGTKECQINSIVSCGKDALENSISHIFRVPTEYNAAVAPQNRWISIQIGICNLIYADSFFFEKLRQSNCIPIEMIDTATYKRAVHGNNTATLSCCIDGAGISRSSPKSVVCGPRDCRMN